ncbi:MAG: DUF1616 domain-containing protein [Syntrophaceticus sp.]|nr:DUF1616 domain-containing protein [Syntrophaceticus sp.]MDD4360589.1 DUF1616 domain-containing protein [Syntrophaceticus sp.]
MDNNSNTQQLHFRIWLEYKATARPFGLFQKRKDLKEEAATLRRKRVPILHQVSITGIDILEIDPHHTVYIKDDEDGRKAAYAPVEILIGAESLDAAIPFLVSKEFSNVELLYPDRLALSPQEFEQVIEKANDELRNYRAFLEIRYNSGRSGNSYFLRDLPGEEKLEKTFSDKAGEEIPPSEEVLPEKTAPEDLPGDDISQLGDGEPPSESDKDEDVAQKDSSHLTNSGLPSSPDEAAAVQESPEAEGSAKKMLRLEYDLEIIAVLSLLLAGVIVLGGEGWMYYLRIGLGLPFVLFFPGYALIAALFPEKDDLGGIERVALSFGLSIAVAPLIGLGLNYTPWGIRLTPILISLVIFILLMGAISFFRKDKLPKEDRFCPVFEFEVPVWREQPVLDKVLSIALIASILFAVGSICYVVAMPKVGEQFTEFYILGMDGKAEGYPQELKPGEEGEVIVGVVNHEYQQEKYYVEVRMDDQVLPREGPITLEHEKEWERTVTFSYPQVRENLKVEFLLYREGDEEPYRSLHLWVNIQENAG